MRMLQVCRLCLLARRDHWTTRGSIPSTTNFASCGLCSCMPLALPLYRLTVDTADWTLTLHFVDFGQK